MKAKFNVVFKMNGFDIVNEHGITFSFSHEVGVALAIGVLVQKSLHRFLQENDASKFDYELILIEKQ